MIKSIRINSLFGRYNYFIDFSKSKMTVIAGPNGYGKTTVLNIIRDVLDDDLYHLSSIVFKYIELETTKGEKLCFSKDETGFYMNAQKLYIPESISFDDKNGILFVLNSNDVNELRVKHKKYVMPQQILSIGELKADGVEAYTEDIVLRINFQLVGNTTMSAIDSILRFYEDVGNTIFCSADRLFHSYSINDGSHNRRNTYGEVIKTLPRRMNELFNYYNGLYTQMSNDLDFSFVSQLNQEIINGSAENEEYTEDKYNQDMAIINNRLDRLVNYGFLTREKLLNKEISFNQEYRVVFKIFANNYLKKLEMLEKLTDELNLFERIVNTKLTNKKVIIRNNRYIDNIIQVKDGNITIPLSSLSSGEKEIIVMYYNLIFETNQNLIALVDEPELSSHVSWQYEALDDFDKILEANSSLKQIIICTHSPQIINNRWDSVIDLYEQASTITNEQ